jgi:osmotically-inducible protein OsmY
MKTDNDLQRDVLAELKWEPGINPAHIGVSVKHGVVTLTGHVSSYPEKTAAERAARRVAGVRAVANELDVKLPDEKRCTDEDLAAAAVAALESNTEVPAGQIKLTVSQGWVKLEGEVEWEYQKDAAEQAIRYLPSVVGISNLITVKPHVAPQDVQARIADALTRSAARQVRRIRIEVRGNKVILRGRVRSSAEKEEAERIAWSAPGIAEVDNQIVVAEDRPAWLVATIVVVVLSLLTLSAALPRLLSSDERSAPPANLPRARPVEGEKPKPGLLNDGQVEPAPNAPPPSPHKGPPPSPP